MFVDGKEIARRIYETVRDEIITSGHAPRLGILTCAPTFETERYLAIKQKKATEVGIRTRVLRLEEETSEEELLAQLDVLIRESDGVVVQLPLPAHINKEVVLASVPPSHDVDALNPQTDRVLSPVVGAITEILKTYEVPVFEKHVVVIGSGRLVGLPASQWFSEHGASVSIVTKDTADIAYYTKTADIIVSGAGVPGLITPDMVKDGVVILDAGTSEDGGMLRGDADPQCGENASLFTPVPGGIGPITIAVLLRNVVELSR